MVVNHKNDKLAQSPSFSDFRRLIFVLLSLLGIIDFFTAYDILELNNLKGETLVPRGRKPVLESVDAKLATIDSEIEAYKSKISSLQAEKKVLIEKQKKMELEALYKAVQESGKSVEELIALIDQK